MQNFRNWNSNTKCQNAPHTRTHARTELRPTLDGKGHLEYNKLSILINRATDNTFSISVSLDFKDLDIL
jgi:hypothetical protein